MKKSLIALAALAAATGAFAQSSVTLFGIVDATVARGTGSATSKTQLTNSGYNSSRLGFRGVEDLGGGMSASFWLEAGLNNDDGRGAATNTNNQASGAAISGIAGGQGLTFNRRSTVSLSGGWGEVRLGRDYTPQFWNLTVFDPFGTNGVGTNQIQNSIITGVTSTRASNGIGYFLPGNLGGIYGQVQYYMGENNTGSVAHDDGTGYGLRIGYAAGPLNIAAAASRTKYRTAGASGVSIGGVALNGDVHQNNIGGQYDFGVAKLQAQFAADKNGGVKARGWLIGGLVPVGAGEIRVAYSQYEVRNFANAAVNRPETKKLALGYVHNLSKRTAVYATYARVRNDGFGALTASQALNGATGFGNASSNGYDLGIRHSF
jgi:predicted porin